MPFALRAQGVCGIGVILPAAPDNSEYHGRIGALHAAVAAAEPEVTQAGPALATERRQLRGCIRGFLPLAELKRLPPP
jgi:hypothetical protein